MAKYTPPSGDQVNFGLGPYTPPPGDQVNFEFVTTETTTYSVDVFITQRSYPVTVILITSPQQSYNISCILSGVLTGWKYRRKITLRNVTSPENKYQILLKIGESSSSPDFDFHLNGRSFHFFPGTDGEGDIRFTGPDGVTFLNFWTQKVVGVAPNRTAYVWIKIETAGDADIFCYYGNPYASGTTDVLKTFDPDHIIGFLVCEWHLDGSAVDTSGNNNSGNINGNTTWVSGKYNKAFSLQGSQFITADSSPSLRAINFSDAYTIAFWFKPGPSASGTLFSTRYGEIKITLVDLNTFKVSWNQYEFTYDISQYGITLTSGEWYYLVLTKDEIGNGILYINDLQVGARNGIPSLTLGTPPPSVPPSPFVTIDVFIAQEPINVDNLFFIVGWDLSSNYAADVTIDELHVYKESLSREDVIKTFNYYSDSLQNSHTFLRPYITPDVTIYEVEVLPYAFYDVQVACAAVKKIEANAEALLLLKGASHNYSITCQLEHFQFYHVNTLFQKLVNLSYPIIFRTISQNEHSVPTSIVIRPPLLSEINIDLVLWGYSVNASVHIKDFNFQKGYSNDCITLPFVYHLIDINPNPRGCAYPISSDLQILKTSSVLTGAYLKNYGAYSCDLYTILEAARYFVDIFISPLGTHKITVDVNLLQITERYTLTVDLLQFSLHAEETISTSITAYSYFIRAILPSRETFSYNINALILGFNFPASIEITSAFQAALTKDISFSIWAFGFSTKADCNLQQSFLTSVSCDVLLQDTFKVDYSARINVNARDYINTTAIRITYFSFYYPDSVLQKTFTIDYSISTNITAIEYFNEAVLSKTFFTSYGCDVLLQNLITFDYSVNVNTSADEYYVTAVLRGTVFFNYTNNILLQNIVFAEYSVDVNTSAIEYVTNANLTQLNLSTVYTIDVVLLHAWISFPADILLRKTLFYTYSIDATVTAVDYSVSVFLRKASYFTYVNDVLLLHKAITHSYSIDASITAIEYFASTALGKSFSFNYSCNSSFQRPVTISYLVDYKVNAANYFSSVILSTGHPFLYDFIVNLRTFFTKPYDNTVTISKVVSTTYFVDIDITAIDCVFATDLSKAFYITYTNDSSLQVLRTASYTTSAAITAIEYSIFAALRKTFFTTYVTNVVLQALKETSYSVNAQITAIEYSTSAVLERTRYTSCTIATVLQSLKTIFYSIDAQVTAVEYSTSAVLRKTGFVSCESSSVLQSLRITSCLISTSITAGEYFASAVLRVTLNLGFSNDILLQQIGATTTYFTNVQVTAVEYSLSAILKKSSPITYNGNTVLQSLKTISYSVNVQVTAVEYFIQTVLKETSRVSYSNSVTLQKTLTNSILFDTCITAVEYSTSCVLKQILTTTHEVSCIIRATIRYSYKIDVFIVYQIHADAVLQATYNSSNSVTSLLQKSIITTYTCDLITTAVEYFISTNLLKTKRNTYETLCEILTTFTYGYETNVYITFQIHIDTILAQKYSTGESYDVALRATVLRSYECDVGITALQWTIDVLCSWAEHELSFLAASDLNASLIQNYDTDVTITACAYFMSINVVSRTPFSHEFKCFIQTVLFIDIVIDATLIQARFYSGDTSLQQSFNVEYSGVGNLRERRFKTISIDGLLTALDYEIIADFSLARQNLYVNDATVLAKRTALYTIDFKLISLTYEINSRLSRTLQSLYDNDCELIAKTQIQYSFDSLITALAYSIDTCFVLQSHLNVAIDYDCEFSQCLTSTVDIDIFTRLSQQSMCDVALFSKETFGIEVDAVIGEFFYLYRWHNLFLITSAASFVTTCPIKQEGLKYSYSISYLTLVPFKSLIDLITTVCNHLDVAFSKTLIKDYNAYVALPIPQYDLTHPYAASGVLQSEFSTSYLTDVILEKKARVNVDVLTLLSLSTTVTINACLSITLGCQIDLVTIPVFLQSIDVLLHGFDLKTESTIDAILFLPLEFNLDLVTIPIKTYSIQTDLSIQQTYIAPTIDAYLTRTEYVILPSTRKQIIKYNFQTQTTFTLAGTAVRSPVLLRAVRNVSFTLKKTMLPPYMHQSRTLGQILLDCTKNLFLICPLTPFGTKLTEDTSTDLHYISVESTEDFEKDFPLVLEQVHPLPHLEPDISYTFINDIQGTTIFIRDKLEKHFSKGDYVYPAIIGVLDIEELETYGSHQVMEIKITVTEKFPFYAPVSSGMTTEFIYEPKTIIVKEKPIDRRSFFQRESGQGTFSAPSVKNKPLHINHEYLFSDDSWRQLRDAFFYALGRVKTIRVPTWRSDLIVVSPASAGSTQIRVNPTTYIDYWMDYPDLLIEGQKVTVVNCSVIGAACELTLDTALNKDILVNTPVHTIIDAYFSDDVLTLNFETPPVCKVSVGWSEKLKRS